jgi:hypothetical protein
MVGGHSELSSATPHANITQCDKGDTSQAGILNQRGPVSDASLACHHDDDEIESLCAK